METITKRLFQDYLKEYCHQNTDNYLCELINSLITFIAPVLILGIACIGIYFLWAVFKSKKKLKAKMGGLSLGVFLLFFSIFLFTSNIAFLYLGLGSLGLLLYLEKNKKD